MKIFELTREARQDLKLIAIYTEKRWGRDQRYLYLKQFDDSFHFLARNPAAGKNCEALKAGFKKFPHGSHLIFYRQNTENKILIVRILHKNMDVKSRVIENHPRK